MLRPAFSTVACHSWTLERVVAAAAEWGYVGVELRSFGEGGTEFACDPALTDGAKVRRLFREAGVEVAGVASGVRFDAPIRPPVLGHVLSSREASVREGMRMVEVARDCAASYLRVFGFDIGREKRDRALRRIGERLGRVCDHARGRGVTVLIENGGSFPLASDLVEIIRRVASPELAACYDAATALAAGDDPVAAIDLLGPLLRAIRLRDTRGDRPVPLGEGGLPARELLRALRKSDETWGTDPWVVWTWDRAWIPGLAPAEEALPGVPERIAEWAGGLGGRHKPAAFQSAAPAMVL